LVKIQRFWHKHFCNCMLLSHDFSINWAYWFQWIRKMSLRTFKKNNYCTNGATLAVAVWGECGLGYFCPSPATLTPWKRITL